MQLIIQNQVERKTSGEEKGDMVVWRERINQEPSVGNRMKRQRKSMKCKDILCFKSKEE